MRKEKIIDIYFDAVMAKVTGEAIVLWMLLALLAWLITYVLHRRGQMKASTAIAIPILVFYIAFVLTITIIERTPGRQMQYKLELFWTVRKVINGRRELISEIFWNIVLFVPIGGLASLILPVQYKPRKANGSLRRMWRSPWIVILAGLLLSTGIEVTQLLTYRGLFEFDDILYNTLGTAVGVVIYLGFAALHAIRSYRLENQKENN